MKAIRDQLIRASRLREQQRYREAAAAYERILAAAPVLATEWYNLGYCRRMSGEFGAALAAYERAIELGVAEAEEAHLNRGVIFADHLLRPDLAETEYKQALALNANYVPALLNLANLAEDSGDRGQATELYRRVLALAPEHWLALARLAKLLPTSDIEVDLLDRVEGATGRADVSSLDRASLSFALGDVRDKRGEFDLAFAAYRQANALSKAAFGARYDRKQEEALIDRLVAESASPGQCAEAHGDFSPIFICGMFRSGSTLTEQILAGHPRVTPGGELDLLPSIIRRRFHPFPEAAGKAAKDDFLQAAAEYRDRVKHLFPNAELLTDKRPDNFLFIGAIKSMFPSAKIVHTVRHPLDNVLSIYFLHLDERFGYAFDLEDTAHQLLLSRRLMAHWRTLYGDDIIDFNYDEFVSHPRETVGQLLQDLGLDWDETCLEFHKRSNAVKTASVWQVREPLYATSSGRWRNYERQLAHLRAHLSDLI